MAWIRWRTTKSGARLASIQWRDSEGRVRSKALGTSDGRLVKMHLQAVEAEKEGRAQPTVTVDAQEALERFLAHIRLTRSADTHGFYKQKLAPLWGAWAAMSFAITSATTRSRAISSCSPTSGGIG